MAPSSGTPSRERLALPSNMSSAGREYQRAPAVSSSSLNSVHSSSNAQSVASSSSAPSTVESLLAAHATSPDPKLAALDQAVNERNTLSSQNSQLWKLIEKQRSGYNQILKELERVRTERDSYKSKLSAAHGERSHRSHDKSRPSEINANSDQKQKYHDNQPTPRNHSSRSHEAPTTPSRAEKTSLAPLVVPPRADSLPLPASASSSSSPETAPHQHYYSDSISSSNTSHSSSSSRPQNYTPRKNSVTESIRSLHTPPPSHNHAPSTTAPPSFSLPTVYTPQHHHASHPSTATITSNSHQSQAGSTSSTSHSPPSPASASNNSFLSVLNDSRGQALSRDSRITLPDEAKQYIANMGESPMPSPRVNAFQHQEDQQLQVNGSGDLATPTQSGYKSDPDRQQHSQSEFLDLEDEGAGDDDDGTDGDEFEVVGGPLVNPSPLRSKITMEPHPVPLSQQQPQSFSQASPSSYQQQHQAMAVQQQAHARKNGKPHAAVEDFPLPPSTTSVPQTGYPYQTTQAQLYQQQQQRAQIEAARAAEAARQQSLLGESHSSSPDYPEGSETDNYSSYHNPSQSSITLAQDQQSVTPGSDRTDPTPPLQNKSASFRALPLLSTDLPHTTVIVSNSFVRPNDRGKDIISFVISVDPGHGKEPWRIEKQYSDVQALDQRVRGSVGKNVAKKLYSLPEGKLWKDHAPAKVDQRKAVLESYLQSLIHLPLKSNDEAIAFLTSDIMRSTQQPVLQAGHKEGYLTKRGKNFGGWKARYFVLSGPVLEYYDCRGGAHLGSIVVAGAQIGRQQKTQSTVSDDEKEYRHAFLIVEAKKGPGGNHPRHVLCAESDEDRDDWVNMLVRYFSGRYSEDSVAVVPSGGGDDASSIYSSQSHVPRTNGADPRRPTRGLSRDDISKGPAVPISQLPPDPSNAKLFQSAILSEGTTRSSSPSKSFVEPSPTDRHPSTASGDANLARRLLERQGQPSSLPDSSPLSNVTGFPDNVQRANSELGHYPDLQEYTSGPRYQPRQESPERHRAERKALHPNTNLSTSTSSPTTTSPAPHDRVPSPDKMDSSKVKISGPLNGAPIPAGYKFGGKDPAPPANEPLSVSDRREKAKSRSFWGFGRPNGPEKPPPITFIPRAVFGVTLEEALDVASIANLPAIVFRCIQYLETKKADQEEGIYRLSGSSAVIKSLKDRFNMEGDVDLLGSDEYWDPHAIAGLLKGYLRELPASILTRDLHLRFLTVMEIHADHRIKELSNLVAALPITNYSLLRALTAHLILIVQNQHINKMSMRNVGIVFSPTLGIPAGVFSLMLQEFNLVFNVDAQGGEVSELARRNSQQYSEAAADQLLGLSGRTLKAPIEPVPDVDEVSAESANEAAEEGTTESQRSSPGDGAALLTPPKSRASQAAAMKGLNVSVTKSDRGNRYSRMMGLPASPRPPNSPVRPASPSAAPS